MKYNKKHIILAVLLPIQIGVVKFLSTRPDWVETYYAQGMYPKISYMLCLLFGWIPFSVGDILIIVAIILLLRKIVKLFRTRFKTFTLEILKITAFFSVVYCCFYLFWGMNYFRKPLAENLGVQTSKYSTEVLTETTKKVITKLNKIHFEITKNDTVLINNPYKDSELFKIAVNGYDQIAKIYPQLKYQKKSIKKSLLSFFHMYGGTSGYINPLTNEAQINSMIPRNSMPFTICHEMAHQIGWNPENEANFVGFLATIHNDNIYFQYAGYRTAFRYLIVEVKKQNKEQYKKLWNTVNKGVSKDFNNSYKVWKQYENPIKPYIKKGYSSYLKANNQQKGIASYSYVVDLLIGYINTKKVVRNP